MNTKEKYSKLLFLFKLKPELQPSSLHDAIKPETT